MIPLSIKQKIKLHAEATAPKECCGFVLEEDIFECKNYAENPDHNFSISPKDYLKASRKGEFKAVYHSHPQGDLKFSPYDIRVSESMNLDFVLYHNPTKKFLLYNPSNKKITSLNE